MPVRGYLLHREGEHARAIEFLDRVLSKHPHFAQGYLVRAYCLFNGLRYEEAIRDSRQVERLDQRAGALADAYRVRIWALMRLGREDEAARECNRWVSLQPWQKDPYVLRGDLLAAKGRTEEAKTDYTTALGIDPSDESVRAKLAALTDVARGGGKEKPMEPPPTPRGGQETPQEPPFVPPSEDPKEPTPAPAPSAEPGETKFKEPVLKSLDRIATKLTELRGALHVAVLVDVSPSMANTIHLVSERLEECLKPVLKDRQVRIVLATYDSTCGFVTEWESSLAPIMRRMNDVKTNGTGREMLMAAIEQMSVSLSSKHGNRAIIVLTDEVGSDAERLERAIAAAKGGKIRVFVVGPEAPFGWPFHYEEGKKFLVATDAGPETARAEILQTSPIGKPAGYKAAVFESERLQILAGESVLLTDLGFDTQIGSGYGPYALVRLTRETGGSYFFLREPHFKETEINHYAPDWCSVTEYDRLAKEDKVRRAIAAVLAQWPQPEGYGNSKKQIEQFKFLPHVFDRSARNQAVIDARTYIRRIEEQLAVLDGCPSPKPGKTESRRWDANLDLIKAQLAVMKHYLHQYVIALEEWKPGPEVVWGQLNHGKRNDSWWDADKAYEDAKKRLGDIDFKHPRTPWSETAHRHLDRLDGFSIIDLKAQGPGAGGVGTPAPKERGK